MSRRPRRTPPEGRAPEPPRAPRRNPLHAGAPLDPDGRVWRIARVVLITLFAVAALAMILRPDRVGDVMAETDFYGGYGPGARLIEHGHLDPSRYAVVGPVFEIVLALVGFVVRDLYLAGALVSLLAAVAALALWGDLLRRRAGAPLAAVATAFLVVNAGWFRYAWSATTDALALGLQALALWWLCAPRSGARPLARAAAAGAIAALAFLTRYTSIALVPAALAAIAFRWTADPGAPRPRLALAWLGGFAALVAPWLAYSFAHGGRFEVQLHHNLAYDVFARARGIPWDTYQQTLQSQFPTPWSVFAHDPGAVMRRLAFNVVDHLRLDALAPVGMALAVLSVLGLVLLPWSGFAGGLAPLLVFAGMVSLSLVPAFHSPRYALPMLPAWAALAAAFVVSPRFALPLGTRGPWLKAALALGAVVLLVRINVAETRRTLAQMPVEVVQAARAVRPLARPGDRVLARKPHFAWQAGLEPVPFPFADSLPQLAADAHQRGARWLWFSWPEAETRPQFWYLLDTTSHVPGLTPRVVTDHHAAVLYEIGPEFGQPPAWAGDPLHEQLHVNRGRVRVLEGDGDARLFLAIYERRYGDPVAAQPWIEQVVALRPYDPSLRVLEADNLVRIGREGEAVLPLNEAVRMAPGDPQAQLIRGWAEFAMGNERDAANLWEPMIEQCSDPGVLDLMVALYTKLGNAPSAKRAADRRAQLPSRE